VINSSQKTILAQGKMLLVGNRIPRDFFITSGAGQSDITIHAGSYHLALKDAGIEMCNIITYSSILPSIATEVRRPDSLVHGSVMESIIACSNAKVGQTATAGIIFGWLYDRSTGEKYGGLVCEYSENGSENDAEKSLRLSLDELYLNGFSEKYELRDVQLITKSFVPKKTFGTALVALCFLNYLYPTSDYN
jgi:arginine decarboxylase